MSGKPRGAKARVSKSSMTLAQALRALDRVAEGAPIAGFGQTALWDEPMKTIVATGTDRTMVVGIQNLDYFSRLRTLLPDNEWQIVSRNDGSLREAWIAAGELSALFGAEVWPTRQTLTRAGVRFNKNGNNTSSKNIECITSAWGWRGIVQNTVTPAVICEVKLRDVAPALLELLEWGFDLTASSLDDPKGRCAIKKQGKLTRDVVTEFLAKKPKATLSDLFENLMQHFYELLLGSIPENVRFETTRNLYRFNRDTAKLRRFDILDRFLNPKSSRAACAAYDQAVADGGMNQLAEFGPGALPFDIYIPGRGRGTLHIASESIRIALPRPLNIPLSAKITDNASLAAVIEDALGPGVSLLGKAATLPAMICGEFVMLLTETSSVYIPRTRHMLELMKASGIPFSPYPILRMRLRTWDSMNAFDANLRLPKHLARAFEKKVVTTHEFARRWERVARNQGKLLGKLGKILSPCELVEYLGHEEHEDWFARLQQCVEANAQLLALHRKTDSLRHEALGIRAREDAIQDEAAAIEKQRGELNRTRLRPLKRKLNGGCGELSCPEFKKLRAEHERAAREGDALLMALAAKQKERRELREKRKEIGRQLRAMERGPEARATRRIVQTVQRAAEKTRIRLAREAILVSEGLHRSNLRPPAWWMPALDPSGKWFDAIRRTARFYLEPLSGERP